MAERPRLRVVDDIWSPDNEANRRMAEALDAALAQAYGLALKPGRGLDHGLAFQALAGGQVDLIDVYSTDAQIGRLGLTP